MCWCWLWWVWITPLISVPTLSYQFPLSQPGAYQVVLYRRHVLSLTSLSQILFFLTSGKSFLHLTSVSCCILGSDLHLEGQKLHQEDGAWLLSLPNPPQSFLPLAMSLFFFPKVLHVSSFINTHIYLAPTVCQNLCRQLQITTSIYIALIIHRYQDLFKHFMYVTSSNSTTTQWGRCATIPHPILLMRILKQREVKQLVQSHVIRK